MLRPLVLVALLVLVPALARAQDETRRYFGDWLAACRADLYCSATAYVNPGANGTVADYVLRLGRHGQEPYWELSLSTVAAMGDAGQPFTIAVDANPALSFEGPEAVGAYGSVNDFFFLGPNAQAAVDQFTPGRRAVFGFIDDTGMPRSAEFSLSGLSAALMWIDEQQQRIGSERVASVPPVGLVPAGGGGSAPAQIPQALLDRHRADPECAPLEQLPNGDDIVAADMGGGYALYILPCQSYAYNFGYKLYRGLGADDFDALYFAYYTPDFGWSGLSMLFSPELDPATGTLMSAFKDRGLGDCGWSGSWTWSELDFRLDEFYQQSCSDEVAPDAPVEFPQVYPQPGASR